MASLQAAGGGDGLHTWRVAGNIEQAVADNRQRVVLKLKECTKETNVL
jgi:hypothetical protein